MLAGLKIDHSQKTNLRIQRTPIVVVLIIIVQLLVFPDQYVMAQTENSEKASYKDFAVSAASLVLQPIYLGVKLAIGITGTVISGVTLIGTLGNEQAAGEVFDKSWAGPWGLPEFFKDNKMENSTN